MGRRGRVGLDSGRSYGIGGGRRSEVGRRRGEVCRRRGGLGRRKSEVERMSCLSTRTRGSSSPRGPGTERRRRPGADPTRGTEGTAPGRPGRVGSGTGTPETPGSWCPCSGSPPSTRGRSTGTRNWRRTEVPAGRRTENPGSTETVRCTREGWEERRVRD